MAPLADIGIAVNHANVHRATPAIASKALDVHDDRVHIPSVTHGEVVIVEME